jgi:hypothetical protein
MLFTEPGDPDARSLPRVDYNGEKYAWRRI